MKLLFVHDHKFRKVENVLYSTGGLNNEVLERYSKNASQVTVIARIFEEGKSENKWSKITNKKILIKGDKGLYYNNLKQEILMCDKMIIRLPSFLGLQALRLNRKIGKPYMIEMVACPWDALWNHGFAGKILAPYIFFRNRKELKDAPMVLYVTNQFLQYRYPTKGKAIGCSDVVISDFNENILNRRREKIEHCGKKKILGTIAAINVKYKGQQYIIESLGKLKRQGKEDFEYQLVGNGDSSFLKSIAKKNNVEEQVKFIGGLPHEKIFEWLDSIDIYVQPSRQEGMPRALIEAMSRGIPAFGAKTGGIPELLPEQYLFSNSSKNINEIIKILESLQNGNMMQLAEQNYEVAKKYRGKEIQKVREEFYLDFYNGSYTGKK
ncbi:MAG: glycosyltransferase [Lachnospiraceae bacterium]|jgi:glycosyltransferase involved in cell wall biosynthesis|nr:glycosyltransferase [Lachnospiraceae bacterium]